MFSKVHLILVIEKEIKKQSFHFPQVKVHLLLTILTRSQGNFYLKENLGQKFFWDVLNLQINSYRFGTVQGDN